MTDEQGFRKSTVTLTVLSQASIEGWELGTVLRECEEGDCVLASTGFNEQPLTGKEMADALYDAASDPGFFRLDDDGNTVDE
jgi:hypothetical protein